MRGLKVGGLALALLGAAGCDDRGGIPENQPVQMKAKLESFGSCEALESYIEDMAVLDMRATMERSKPSYYKGGWGFFGGDVAVDEAAPVPASGSPNAGGATPPSPTDYTGTNNQVAGVDEADFVKNDGTRLFVLSGQKLYLHRSWPAESLHVESSLVLEGYPRQMFLRGDKVIVFSTVYGSGPEGSVSWSCTAIGPCPMYGTPFTKVTTVDVSNLSAPQVTGELYLPGGYHDARLAGSSVRLVMNDSLRWPTNLRWWPDYSQDLWNDTARLEKELDKLMDENEQLIRARTLKDWVPDGQRKLPDGTLEPVGYDCQDYHKTNAPTRPGFVTVASIDLDAQTFQAPGRTGLVAEPGEVYATDGALYLASSHWWWWPEPGQHDYTYVHKLDLSQPGRVTYVASGSVEGHLLNQFSMDEYEGVLRVATTLSTRVKDSASDWGRLETSNRVSTWREANGQLQQVGQSEELAKGERIYSARFLGDKGYVVTFRQVDPLFTFDLSDPEHPRKVGELKVPGYSSYIHPLDATHLLTVGEYVPENGDWRSRAIKLSLFDVTDPAHPRETFSQLVGTAYGWSESLYDHKAFNYFPAKGLVAIPFMDWSQGYGDYWNNFVSELRVFRVDPATGITPVGAVSMKDVYQTVNYYQWSWTYSPAVRRSVMADDYVYAITDAGARVARLGNLAQPLATTRFEPVVSGYGYPAD